MPGPRRQDRDSPLDVPALETWLETPSTSLDLIPEVSTIADSEIRNLDFDDSVNVGANTQLAEVHQGPVRVTYAILVSEQARPWIFWSQRCNAPQY